MTTLSPVATALLTTIRATPGGAFVTANTSRGDFRVLDAESHTFAATIYRRQPSTIGNTGPGGRGTHGKRVHQHFFRILLAIKRGDGQGGDGATVTALEDQADALVAHLERYPRLGGTVATLKRADVSNIGDVRVAERGRHMTMVVDVDAVCEVPIAWAEGAQ